MSEGLWSPARVGERKALEDSGSVSSRAARMRSTRGRGDSVRALEVSQFRVRPRA